MKSSGIGGQAVLEGVMMKNKDIYAVAVRKPDGEIAIDKKEYQALGNKIPFFKLPVIRGVIVFIESLIIGIKTLTYSSSFYEDEEVNKSKKEKTQMSEGLSTFFLIFFSMCMAIGIFIVLPYFASQFLGGKIKSQAVLSLIEGILRILLFVGYVAAISQMNDIKRVFMYHGAEHKTINCIEHGYELTVNNVRRQSLQNKRCGTSFLLIVMFVSVLFFIFIRVEVPWLRLVLRLLLVPVIAGVSYEFLKLAGRSESKLVHILSQPGLWLQRLTTKEPDDAMIEVAIQSVEAVFDWRTFIEESNPKRNRSNSAKKYGKKDTKKGLIKETKSDSENELKKEIESESENVFIKDTESESKNKPRNTSKNKSKNVPIKKDTVKDFKKQINITNEIEIEDYPINDNSIKNDSIKSNPIKDSSKKDSYQASVKSAKTEIAASLEPDEEEEEDDILKALDKFLEFEGKKE